MVENNLFKSKDEVICKTRTIIEEHKGLFDLEDENIKVSYYNGDKNNASVSMMPIGKNNIKICVSKLDYNYSDKALELLIGHELTHAKFFKGQEKKGYIKGMGEGIALLFKLGKIVGKEIIIKRMILETLCDIHAIRIMKANEKEIDSYFNRGVIYEDKSYLMAGYLPPSQRRLLAAKYSLNKRIKALDFGKDFMVLYNKVAYEMGSDKLLIESLDEIESILRKSYYKEFDFGEGEDEKKALKVYRF